MTQILDLNNLKNSTQKPSLFLAVNVITVDKYQIIIN
jgi:hypothetical protein